MSTFTVLNPATEQAVASVPASSAEQADEAISRAAAAQPGWRAVAPGERASLLRRFADVVDAHNEELAQLEVTGSGHPVGQARWEAGNVARRAAVLLGRRRNGCSASRSRCPAGST